MRMWFQNKFILTYNIPNAGERLYLKNRVKPFIKELENYDFEFRGMVQTKMLDRFHSSIGLYTFCCILSLGSVHFKHNSEQ